MSGTSADGVDAALVEISGHGEALEVIPRAFCVTAYPKALRQRLLQAATQGTVADICHLNVVVGAWFAEAVHRVIKQAGINTSQVDLIGSHGQTVHHLPHGQREGKFGVLRSTLQIGEPAVIAERTGIATVANFRPRDMAAGGQGAPLTPYAHYLLLRHPQRGRLIVNLGGISNVTYLPPGGGLDAIQAFDTGPGNMLLDAAVHRLTTGRAMMDKGGRLAAKGRIDPRLLKACLAHRFFKQAPPKSTGREAFGEVFLKKIFTQAPHRRVQPNDLLATLSRFTAEAVGQARRWLKGPVDEVVVGGGGVHNRALMAHLAEVWAPCPVVTFDEAGWDSKAFEAVAFAVLGYQTVQGHAANVPAVTGAAHPVVLGSITPGAMGRLPVVRSAGGG
jgi:anhydro-N-acetylmuramic acid kinase